MRLATDGTKAAANNDAEPRTSGKGSSNGRPRIALLTPYNGGNLGDAAIQDSMIANIRLRLPSAQFSGICLNCENFIERHGTDAFPLCGIHLPFYHMVQGRVGDQPKYGVRLQPVACRTGFRNSIKRTIRNIRPLWRLLKGTQACLREVHHWVRGYCFLRTHDLLIVSGGGQINEEWGGTWAQPFALFKWAILARFARVPYVIAGVGLGKVRTRASRALMSATFRMAQQRSYRDKNTKAFAASLLRIASNDPVVSDHVLALPASEMPLPGGNRALARGRPIVAISPIAYAKPQKWPSEDRTTYERYIVQMARVMSELLERGCFLVVVCSSLWDDESAIADLLEHLDERSKALLAGQMRVPAISTWKDLVGSLLDVDVLIASRLHSVILGFVSQSPVVAVSFEPKVEWVMEDLGQTDCLVRIRDFAAEDVLAAFDRILVHRSAIIEHIASCRREILSASALHYDALAEIARQRHSYLS